MNNILFLCTGNSARSILAEVLLNDLGGGRFHAKSAGSRPAGSVNPGALRKLQRSGHKTEGLRSKSWDEFAGADAEKFDAVITVCGNAANEVCPVWQGSPVTVHWGMPDPALQNATDEEIDQAFDTAYAALRRRIAAMVELPMASMTASEKQSSLASIHDSERR